MFQIVAVGIGQRESVERVKNLVFGATVEMNTPGAVLHDAGQRNQPVTKIMRSGIRKIGDLARGERGGLAGLFKINRRRCILHHNLLLEFLKMVEDKLDVAAFSTPAEAMIHESVEA